jgi:hypothetical protein
MMALDVSEMPQSPSIVLTKSSCQKLAEESFKALLGTGLVRFGWRGQRIGSVPRNVFRQTGLLGIFVGLVPTRIETCEKSHLYPVCRLGTMSSTYIAD